MKLIVWLVVVSIFLGSCAPERVADRPLTYFGHRYEECKGYPSVSYYVWVPEVAGLCGWYPRGELREKNLRMTKRFCRGLVRQLTKGKVTKDCVVAFEGNRVVDRDFQEAIRRYRDIPVTLKLVDESGTRIEQGVMKRFPHQSIRIMPFEIHLRGRRLCKGQFRAGNLIEINKFSVNCFQKEYQGTVSGPADITKVGSFIVLVPERTRIKNPSGAYIDLSY